MPRMTGKKPRKAPGNASRTFADNLLRLIQTRFATYPNKNKAAAAAAGVTLSTIQRALAAEHAPTLDTVEAIAAVFGLAPYQMLVDKLDIEKPQAIAGPNGDPRRRTGT